MSLQVPQSASSTSQHFAAQGPKKRTGNLLLGPQGFYEGPFQGLKVITDYGGIKGQTEETSNAEITDRFSRVLSFTLHQRDPVKEPPQGFLARVQHWFKTLWDKLTKAFRPPEDIFGLKLAPWTAKKHPLGILPVNSISDVPGGNADFVALSLLRLGGSEKNQRIFIHVVDPGVGIEDDGSHDRTILVTKEHGIYIGPNNGSLGLLYLRLLNEGDPPKLYQIDVEALELLERKRLNNPTYRIPPTFHGRDIFAVAAGLIAGGVDPAALAVRDDRNNPVQIKPKMLPFAKIAKLPKKGETTTVYALQDNTFGNLKLNVQLSDLEYSFYRQGGRRFQVRKPGSDEWLDLPLKQKFNDVPKGELLLYHGSSGGVLPGTRFLEIAANLDFAAKKLGISDTEAQPLEIRCI